MRGSAKKDRHVTFQNNGSQLLDIPHAVAIESGEVFSHSHVHALVNKHRDNPTMVHVKGHRHPHL